MSNLIRRLLEILKVLERAQVHFAAIGGLAVVAHGVIRATEDLDFLVDGQQAPVLDGLMTQSGFRRLHSSQDAANYADDSIRIDFLFAHRPIAVQLLAEALPREVMGQRLPVIRVEGIMGLKLQALANDPRRTRDNEDIRALLRLHRQTIDLDRVRGYFALFDREEWLDEMLRELSEGGDEERP